MDLLLVDAQSPCFFPLFFNVQIPLAEVAANQDGDVSREEMYNYANYFDNTTTVIMHIAMDTQGLCSCAVM